MSKRFEKIAGAILFTLILLVGINLGGNALDHALIPPAPEPAPMIAEAPAPAADAPAEIPAETASAPDVAPAEGGTEAAPAEGGTEAALVEGMPDLSPEPIAPLVAVASVDAGQAGAKKCVACHTFDQGAPHRVGPNLHNIVGRDIGTAEGYGYSGVMKALDGKWTDEALDSYLLAPKTAVPGTKMAFAGVKDVQERAALIAYLRSVSPDAPPLEE